MTAHGWAPVPIQRCPVRIGVVVQGNAALTCGTRSPQVAGQLGVVPRPADRRCRSGSPGRGRERPPISACLDRHRAGWRCASPSSPPLRGRSRQINPWQEGKRTLGGASRLLAMWASTAVAPSVCPGRSGRCPREEPDAPLDRVSDVGQRSERLPLPTLQVDASGIVSVIADPASALRARGGAHLSQPGIVATLTKLEAGSGRFPGDVADAMLTARRWAFLAHRLEPQRPGAHRAGCPLAGGSAARVAGERESKRLQSWPRCGPDAEGVILASYHNEGRTWPHFARGEGDDQSRPH